MSADDVADGDFGAFTSGAEATTRNKNLQRPASVQIDNFDISSGDLSRNIDYCGSKQDCVMLAIRRHLAYVSTAAWRMDTLFFFSQTRHGSAPSSTSHPNPIRIKLPCMFYSLPLAHKPMPFLYNCCPFAGPNRKSSPPRRHI